MAFNFRTLITEQQAVILPLLLLLLVYPRSIRNTDWSGQCIECTIEQLRDRTGNGVKSDRRTHLLQRADRLPTLRHPGDECGGGRGTVILPSLIDELTDCY